MVEHVSYFHIIIKLSSIAPQFKPYNYFLLQKLTDDFCFVLLLSKNLKSVTLGESNWKLVC